MIWPRFFKARARTIERLGRLGMLLFDPWLLVPNRKLAASSALAW